MKRRELLGASAAAALTWPGFLARAFAQLDAPIDARALFDAARARARAEGRPVFVIVVPADASEIWLRGAAWGELLSYGSDATMAALALAEVVCVEASVAVTGVRTDDDPFAIVLEPDGRVRVHGATFAPHPRARRVSADVEAAIDDQIAVLSQLVHDALAADDAMIARRAADAHAARGDALAPLAEALARGAVTPELAATGPALVYEVASWPAADAPPLFAVLTQLAVATLRGANVPGSTWEERDPCQRCGMAYASPRSRHVLRWMVAT